MRYPMEATGSVDGIPGLLERSFGERWSQTPMIGGGRKEGPEWWGARVHDGAEAYLKATGLGEKNPRSGEVELKGLESERLPDARDAGLYPTVKQDRAETDFGECDSR